MRFFSKSILVFGLLFVFLSIVKADPIRITVGGSYVYPSYTQGVSTGSDYNFEGTELRATGTTIFGSFNNSLCLSNCDVVGSRINLTSQFYTGDIRLYPLGYNGNVSYLGNTYRVTQSSFSFLAGDTNPFPPLSSFTNGDYTTATANFNMNATLSLRSLSTTVPNAILQLTGSGIASIDYVYNPTRAGLDIGFVRYRYSNVEGEFTSESTPNPTPEPVPEPTTVLLLGTGLAGIIGYTRKKRKK